MFKIFSTKCYLDFNKNNNINILSSKYNFDSLCLYKNNLNYYAVFDIQHDDNNNIILIPTDCSIELELLGIIDYSHRYSYQDLMCIIGEIEPDDITLDINGYGNTDRDDFKKVVTVEDYDYSNMITQLEKKGLIETKPSTCVLRTDERKFKIKYDNTFSDFYEVDCLGTSHKIELSERIKDLYLKHFT